MPGYFPLADKTHFIASATQPSDSRVQLGTLWSKTSSNELYICIGIAPVTFQLLTGGSGAPVGSRYVVIGPADGTLTDERVLTAGTNITLTDGGAGGAITIDAAGGGASTLDGLSDVVISTPAATHHLRYNGTNWVNAVIPASDLPSAIDAAKIADGSVSNAEFQRLNGVTGDIQTQLDAKADDPHSHVAADVTDFAEAVDDRVGTLLVQGANITLTYDDVAGTLTIAAAGGGGGAPTDATYVTLSTNGTLTNERVLTAGSGISLTDGGAGSTITISATGGGADNEIMEWMGL
jgi:hypothetical protein